MNEEYLEILVSDVFEEKPVDIEEFVNYYLGLKGQVFPKLMDLLIKVWHEGEYFLVVLDGGIGWGKSTFAKINLLYLFYNAIILKSPQRFLGFVEGTELPILLVGESQKQAKHTLFNDVKTIMQNSPYFAEKIKSREILMYEAKDGGEVRHVGKNVVIVPRGIDDTGILGLNLIGVVMEEVNFWSVLVNSKLGRNYDTARETFDKLHRRFVSRYGNFEIRQLPFIPKFFVVSSNHKEKDLTSQLAKEYGGSPNFLYLHMRSWDTHPYGWHAEETFRVCIGNRQQLPRIIDSEESCRGCKIALGRTFKNCGHKIEEVPADYRVDFERDIVRSVRDYLGYPQYASSPFIADRERVFNCIDEVLSHPWEDEEVVPYVSIVQEVQRWKIPLPAKIKVINPQAKRFIHVDLGLRRDACGIAMGHVEEFVTVERIDEEGNSYSETLPVVRIDLMVRIVPPEEGEIEISEVRNVLYYLQSRGFNIHTISFDGFQSADSIQILKRRFPEVELLSVDRNTQPYEFLRSAIYEGRIRYYHYKPFISELLELEFDDVKGKVDHPPGGSKDVADAVAGVVYHCMIKSKASFPSRIERGYPHVGESPWWERLREL